MRKLGACFETYFPLADKKGHLARIFWLLVDIKRNFNIKLGQNKGWRRMDYQKPEILILASQASTWCNIGSNGEPRDNNCAPGGLPTTTACWGGRGNTTGHCNGGNGVQNYGPGPTTYCGGGNGATGGANPNIPCNTGTNAVGPTGCSNGITACHCTGGNGA
jgi:hypothetical protein